MTEIVKSLVIGDVHMQDSNIKDINVLCEKIIKKAKDVSPTFIVVLGDILHTHEKISVIPFKTACEFLYNLTEIAPTYLLIGNHDYKNNQQFLSENHAFNSLKYWKNMYVIDKVTIHEYNECQFTFLPYVPVGRFLEALNQSGEMWETTNCIFAHQELYGCKMGAITSEEGDVWDESYPLVVSGHIHDHQMVGKNVFYTGSIMQHAFNENSKKYLWQFEFVQNQKYTSKKFDLGMRRKRIISIDLEDAKNFNPNDYAEEDIKLDIRGLSEHFKSFRSSKKFKEIKEKGIKISFNAIHNKVLPDLKLGNTNHKNKTYIAIFRDLSSKESQRVKELCEQVTCEYMSVETAENIGGEELEFEGENSKEDSKGSDHSEGSYYSDEVSSESEEPAIPTFENLKETLEEIESDSGTEEIDWEEEDSESD